MAHDSSLKTAVLTINLAALRQNYKSIQSRTKARVAAVIKADGYGLGALPVSRALYEEGCRDFFVSSPDEGAALRAAIGPAPSIYILNGFYASAADKYVLHNLIPVMGSYHEINAYKKISAETGRPLPAYLSFNIRMNRLGLGKVETREIIANPDILDGFEVKGILSHFACADEAGHPMTQTQYAVFHEIASHFPGAEKSLSNSSGIFRDPRFHFDLVRPGAALYGINPTPELPNPMEPVVRLEAPILRIRMVYAGADIGYGATYRFERDSWIATLAAGYADGLPRALSNRGAVYWRGIRCPIRGRVSMDMMSVDLSDVPESQRPKPGDMMDVLGPSQNADALAHDAGTIGYEILTSLGRRYERVYEG